MKLLRTFFIGVLVLLLPLYGQAAVDLSCHCTMQSGATMHPSAMQQMSGHDMDCCAHHALEKPFEKHNSPEKSGSSGQGGHVCDGCSVFQPLAFLMQLPSLPALNLAQSYTALSEQTPPAQEPEGFWRPPRLI